MKWLMLGLLALFVSVSVALVAIPDPGYVLLGYGKYSIETSLLALAVVLALVYLGMYLLAGLWRVPARVHQWEDRRKRRRLQSLYNEAVIELGEGRLERAERRLARLLKSGQAPLQAYLSAARAASQLGADDRRDAYLKLARERHSGVEVTIASTQGELQLAKSQLDQAQTTLTRLQSLAPRSAQTLRLLMQLYSQQQDWQRLRELLPELQRSQVLGENQWQQLAVRVYREQVREFSSLSDIGELKAGWKQLPRPVQQDEGLLEFYVRQLLRLRDHKQAEHLIATHVKRKWNQRLVYLYGDLRADASAQLGLAERWLEQHPEDPVLLLSLAKISLHNQLWGKARGYLESSIRHQATAEAYRLLGDLLEQLEEPDEAARCYRKGIELIGRGTPDAALPPPEDEAADQGNVMPISRSA